MSTQPPPRPHGPVRPAAGGVLGRGPGQKAAGAAGLVAVALLGSAGGYWLAHLGDAPASTAVSTPSPGASGAATGAATASPSADTPAGTPARRPLTGVAQIDPADVAAQAKRAGLTTRGQPVEAWTWTDTNGRNLFLTTKLVRKTEGGAVRAATLYAYHAAGLDDRPRLLRTLQDPGTPDCPVEFALDFAPGSVTVADTDGDGYGEATVGYAALCAGDPSPRTVKLALVTEGTYFILRGRGLLASDPDLPAGVPYSGVTFRPNLPASRWPAGTYDRTVALFRTLFR